MFESAVPKEKFNRLDTKTRNLLQAEVMRITLPNLTPEAEMTWINTYGKQVSDIIDNVDNNEIRDLAIADRYRESAEILLKLLEGDDEIREAA